MKLRILSGAEVRQALPMDKAIAGMKLAYSQLSAGQTDTPLRARVNVAAHRGTALFMPAYLTQSDDLAVKIVSVYPENAQAGLPAIHGLVLVLEAATGRPAALMEGSVLTAIRTGAGSGAATDILALPDANSAAILGSGVQARTQLEAVCAVRAIQEVRVYSPNRDHAKQFASEMAGYGPIPATIRVAASPRQAVAGADIICAATTSSSPVFDGHDLKPGAHVNAVGSYTPEMQEVDLTTLRRSRLVVDSRAAVLAEAGDLIIPLNNGQLEAEQIHAELGEIINGDKAGRANSAEITTFKSVGVAAQDAAAARIALEEAVAKELGLVVQL